MKNILTIIAFLFSLIQHSQNQEECLTNLSIFAEYAKVKNYNEAYQPWLSLNSNCPDINSAIYVLGEKMLISFVKNSNDDKRLSLIHI